MLLSKNALLLIILATSFSIIALIFSSSLSTSSSSSSSLSSPPHRDEAKRNDYRENERVLQTPVLTATVYQPAQIKEKSTVISPVPSSSFPVIIRARFPDSYFLPDRFPTLQSMSKSWTTLLDQKSGNLQWAIDSNSNDKRKKKPAATSSSSTTSSLLTFQHLLPTSNDKLLIGEIFSKITIEAHGDSTLRELVKFLINRLKVKETLEKKDANMTFRAPKFFTAVVPDDDINPERENLLMRVAFRFDFFGESFLEPYTKEQVPILTMKSGRKNTKQPKSSHPDTHDGNERETISSGDAFSFFERSKANLVLLSAGSHVGKTLIMEKGMKLDSKQLLAEGIFKSIIHPIQDFLLLRCLGIQVERDGSSDEILKLIRFDQNQQNERETTSPNADLVIFFAQSLECSAMQLSQLTGFRLMSKHCPAIQTFLDRLHDNIISEISEVLDFSGEAEDQTETRRMMNMNNKCTKEKMKNSLCHESLTMEERKLLRGRFLFVGPLSCGGGGGGSRDASAAIKFALAGSKPHCSRDGIHLRSKFLRLKLDLLLNVIVNWWKMAFAVS